MCVAPGAILEIRSGEEGRASGEGRPSRARREGSGRRRVDDHSRQLEGRPHDTGPRRPRRKGEKDRHTHDGKGGGARSQGFPGNAGSILDVVDPVTQAGLEILGDIEGGE